MGNKIISFYQNAADNPSTAVDPGDDDDMYSSMYRRRRQKKLDERKIREKERQRRFQLFLNQCRRYQNEMRLKPRPSERNRAFWVGMSDESSAPDTSASGDDKEVKPENLSRIPRRRDVTVEPVVVKPEIPKEEVLTKLHVKNIDFHIEKNHEDHHTEKYACTDQRKRKIAKTKDDGTIEYTTKDMPPELVIRRGQEFIMTIEFDRPYDIKMNDINLLFNFGDDHKKHRNLFASVDVDDGDGRKLRPSAWKAKKIGGEGNKLQLNVYVPAFVAVGEWMVCVRTYVGEKKEGEEKDSRLVWQYTHHDEINIIFNPWSKDDWVYLADEAWRNETVLNDQGAVYRGSFRSIGAKPWEFGHYKDEMLDLAFALLRKCHNYESVPIMGNAADVSRQISKIVNCQDDDGVLVGNWSGDYTGGKGPSTWGSSYRILKQYIDDGYKPVKFGQCWVFSAVTVAVCRALGIPCRSVTNFSSAHNTDDLLSIDTITHWDGEETKTDSVWNFHVWNEVWMRRPDLDEKGTWDGWQVIDATPQEKSDGEFRCGPSPVKAVKAGEVTIGKDTEFVFAEVNADKVCWMEDQHGNRCCTRRDRNSVGKKISTHKPTGDALRGTSDGSGEDRLDITNEYKFDEGTEEEKKCVKKAERLFRMMKTGTSEEEDEDVTPALPPKVELSIKDPGDLYVGKGVSFDVQVKNIAGEAIYLKTLILKILYKTYFDDIVGMAAIKKMKGVELEKDQEKTFTIDLEMDRILDESVLKHHHGFYYEVKACAVFFDGPNCTDDLDFRFRVPDIVIKAKDKWEQFMTFDATICFTNPLPVPLTQCGITLDGGFDCKDDPMLWPYCFEIAPGETWEMKLTLDPIISRKKDREMTVNFHSVELPDIVGYHTARR